MSRFNLYPGFSPEQREQVADWLIVYASEQRRMILERFEGEVKAFKSSETVKECRPKVLEARYFYWGSIRSLIKYLHSLGVIDVSEFHEILRSSEFRMNAILSRNGFEGCTFALESIPSVTDLFDTKFGEKSEVYF